MSGRLRRAGARWRLLVNGANGPAHHITPDPKFAAAHPDGAYSRTHLIAHTEFDELAVGSWLHIEQMDNRVWWMNIGGVTVHVTADRDGRPTRVWVCGPEDYDAPREGCTYELTWSDPLRHAKGDSR